MLINFNKKSFLSLFLIFSLFFIISSNNLYAQRSIYIVKDSEIEDFISILLEPIFKVAGVNSKSINIYIVNDNIPNAFVSDGQNMFINTGLLTLASSYNEIAGVLSHELGHITAGHISRGSIAYSNASLLMILGLAGILLTAPFLGNSSTNNPMDIVGFLSYSTIQATQGAMLSYSRSEESQADQIALEYIKQTNYDPKGFYDFMNKLYNKEDKTIYTLPSYAMQTTHPLTSSRMDFINDYIKKHHKHYSINKDLSNRLIKIQAKIKAYNKESNSYKINSVPYIYFEAVKAYFQSNFLASIKLTKELLKRDSNYIYYKELLADSYFGNQDYKSSIIYYKQIVKQIKSDVDLIYYKLALAYFAENMNKEALINTNLSIQINNQNPSTWHLKSLILGKTGKIGDANLALAEKFLIMNDKKRANIFAQQALQALVKNSNEYFEAIDIINTTK